LIETPHVKFADEAVWIGESPSNQSYLLGDKIIEVAKALGSGCYSSRVWILSENADLEKQRNKITSFLFKTVRKAIH
jgi:propionyl-CoA carboxylase alpha chain